MPRFLLASSCLLLLTACNQDQDNVELTGLVYDKATKQPVAGATVRIENATYEGGDYDSYNSYEHYALLTDAAGHFSVKLKKSAYVAATGSKAGYRPQLVTQDVTAPWVELAIPLTR